MNKKPLFHRPALWTVLGLLWLGSVVAGLGALSRYGNVPGAEAKAPATWPAGSRLALDAARPTLVMFAHPRCTCSKASIGELAELMARARARPKTYVVFIKPGGAGGEWERTGLWQSAAEIPRVTVVRDDDGLEARRFGAETSGQTFLYEAGGLLLFSGGTTGARGHPGDNVGRASLLALLNREAPRQERSAVFGCSLFAR